MADEMEIIIKAIDEASDKFREIADAVSSMGSDISDSVSDAGSSFDELSSSAEDMDSIIQDVGDTDALSNMDSDVEELKSQFDQATAEVERLQDALDEAHLNGDDIEADIIADELAEAEAEAERLADALSDAESAGSGLDNVASSAEDVASSVSGIDSSPLDELGDAAGNANDSLQETASNIDAIVSAGFQMEVFTEISDALLECADAAGNYSDSVNRATLEAEGFGISAEEMSSVISEISDVTGRAGGQIRESFIKAVARGVTDTGSFKTMMEGAGAQAYLLGTDIQTMGDKFSSLAMKSTLMERTLAETGITMDELAEAMGMTGATADEVKEKWKELDVNQRAAILGTAASMNEGEKANEAYKHSWQGLGDQLDIAKGRLERLVGDVLLPTLVPAIEIATGVLNGLGGVVSFVMGSPLGGLISILGSVAAALVIVVTGISLATTVMKALGITSTLTAIETTAVAISEGLAGEGGVVAAIGSAIAATGFGAMGTAAMAAASAVWALISPLLPFIAIGAAIAVIIYEIGKAFNWWHDVGSMLDAIWAGLQRLWSAFINHPDVQAVIKAIGDAWNWVVSGITWAWNALLNFFGIATGGEFDIVRALIDAIGAAWQMVTFPIRMVISAVQWFIGAVQNAWSAISEFGGGILVVLSGPIGWLIWAFQTLWGWLSGGSNGVGGALQTLGSIFSNVWGAISNVVGGVVTPIINMFQQLYMIIMQLWEGNITLGEAIGMIWGTISSTIQEVAGNILEYMYEFATMLAEYAMQAGQWFLENLMSFFGQLPGMIWNSLMSAWNWIASLMPNWVTTGISNAIGFVNGVIAQFVLLPGRVGVYLLQVVTRIVSAGSQWISSAISKAVAVVNGVVNQVKGLPGKVYNEFIKIAQKIRDAISAAVRAATQFGQDVVNAVLSALGIASPGTIQKKTVKEFKDTIKRILGLTGDAYAAGEAYGESVVDGFGNVDLESGLSTDLNTGQLFDIRTGQSYDVDTTQHIEGDITITHDLTNVPEGLNEQEIADLINRSTENDDFMKRIAESVSFQKYDSREKLRIQRRDGRSRGV